MGKILNTDNPQGLNSIQLRNKRNKANIILEEDEVKILVNGKEKYNLANISGGKQDTLVSGTNIKTINGNSILGGGNMVIDIPDELNGTNYLMVYGTGTPTENAAELQAAYDEAKTMSPSASNRITIIVAPGKYTFATVFTLDAEGINIVSLTGNADVIINGVTVYGTSGYSCLAGITATTITIKAGLEGMLYKNCTAGDNSFGYELMVGGTFINCTAGNNSFGGGVDGMANGVFINCTAGDNSFGTIASGVFDGCTGGNNSFGGIGEAIDGRFYYCRGGAGSGLAYGAVALYCSVNNIAV